VATIKKVTKRINCNCVSHQFSTTSHFSRCPEMRLKKKQILEGSGVFTNPSGMEIPRGWRIKTKQTFPGGDMDSFWTYTI